MNSTRSKVLAVVLIGVGALVFFQKSKLFGTIQQVNVTSAQSAYQNAVNFVTLINSLQTGSSIEKALIFNYPNLSAANLKTLATRINDVLRTAAGSVGLPVANATAASTEADFIKNAKNYFTNGLSVLSNTFLSFGKEDITAGQSTIIATTLNDLLNYLGVDMSMSVTVQTRTNSSSITSANLQAQGTKSAPTVSAASKGTSKKAF